MQQLIIIDDTLLKNATHCLATDDVNEVVTIALQELINTHSASNDETAYLLANPANKARLLAAIARVENNQLIDVDIDSL